MEIKNLLSPPSLNNRNLRTSERAAKSLATGDETLL